jgi:hypothetical protein
VREFTEEQISNIRRGAYNHNNLPSPSDEPDDQYGQREVCLSQSCDSEYDKKLTTATLSHEMLNNCLNNNRAHYNESTSRDWLRRSAVSDDIKSHGTERSEIPNTPTQHSSQIEILNSSLKFKPCATKESPRTDDSSQLVEPRGLANNSFVTALCLLCRKKRVLARLGNRTVW